MKIDKKIENHRKKVVKKVAKKACKKCAGVPPIPMSNKHH